MDSTVAQRADRRRRLRSRRVNRFLLELWFRMLGFHSPFAKRSSVFGVEKPVHFPCFSSSVRRSFPSLVSLYFCLLLVGLSGIVISSHPASIRGLSIWFLNLVRSVLPSRDMISVIGCSERQLRRTSTWCRLGADFLTVLRWLPRKCSNYLGVCRTIHILVKNSGFKCELRPNQVDFCPKNSFLGLN